MSFSACYDDTVTYHWYFKRNAGSTAGPVGKTNNMITTPDLDQSGVRISPKSSPRFPLPVLIGSASGPIVGIVLLLSTIILTTWFKSRVRPPLAGLDPNNVGSNKNTADSGNDHQYEDINDHYGQTGQGQANIQSPIVGNLSHDQVLAALSPNPTYLHVRNNPASTEMTRQGQSRAIIESTTHTTATVMASGDDHQYEDADNHHVKTGQGQSPTLPESNTNATAMTSGDDHQYEDVDNHHDQTGQGQSKAISGFLDARNLSYGTGPTVSQQNDMCKAVVHSRDLTEPNTNNITSVMASSHCQTKQAQSQAITESLDTENVFYGGGPTALQPSSLYTDGETP
ncbi:Bax inhibitor 1 [Branchiostoma belcheri]|nr:Bax inhibitor 1 [Branchiostoma belcheri]